MNGLTYWVANDGVIWAPALIAGVAIVGWTIARWVRASDPDWAAGGTAGAAGAPGRDGLTSRARWLLVIWAALGALTFVAIVLGLRDSAGALTAFDTVVAQGLAASLPRPFLAVVALFTRLGDRSFLMGVGASVLVMLLWHRRWALAAVWVVAAAGGGTLNTVLKATFMRVRPDHAHGFLEASGFSFPSGHATGAVAIYGMLAYVLARTVPVRHHAAFFAAACALIAGIGASRVLLHVHFVSDVLAGWAITSAWVAVCILVHEAWRSASRARAARGV